METTLVVLLKHLPALREQGVLTLKIWDIKMVLAPLPTVYVEPPGVAKSEEPPGRDPVTYGLPPGTKMPSLRDRRG